MDWDKLRIFHAVAAAGSFTRAGETLHLSQSAVSRQISALEDSLSVPLFHRHARGLLLTEQGEILQEAVEDIFARLAMIEGKLQDSRELPAGPLRVTAPLFIGSLWLAPFLRDFHDQYPDIRMSLLLDDRVFNLGMSEADAAIRLYKPTQPDLIQSKLATLHFAIYGAESYLKDHAALETAADPHNHTIVCFPENAALPFTDANRLFLLGGSSAETIFVNSVDAMFEMVRAGLGLALLPAWLAKRDETLQRVLPFETVTADMYFVYPEERRNAQRIAVFLDFLKERVVELKEE